MKWPLERLNELAVTVMWPIEPKVTQSNSFTVNTLRQLLHGPLGTCWYIRKLFCAKLELRKLCDNFRENIQMHPAKNAIEHISESYVEQELCLTITVSTKS